MNIRKIKPNTNPIVSKTYKLFFLFGFLVTTSLLTGCYSCRWSDPKFSQNSTSPPPSISKIFSASPDGRLSMEMDSPGKSYKFDPGEKDSYHAEDNHELRFRRVFISLHSVTPPGQIQADLVFEDDAGTKVVTQPVDLLRLIPKIDTSGDMQYSELLLEEFHRFGLGFRKEHNEFEVKLSNDASGTLQEAVKRSHRLGLTNNCLDPRKWEMKLVSEDYSDFKERLASPYYLNQNKTLAHSWFYLDGDLYTALMHLNNPNLTVNPELAANYDDLAKKTEQVVVGFNQKFRFGLPHSLRYEDIRLDDEIILPLEPC